MFKRIPSSFFSSFKDVYFSIIDFMQECGFIIISNNSKHLFYNIPTVYESYVLKDPNTEHYLCLSYYNWLIERKEDVDIYADYKISLFVFDNYDYSKDIYEQSHVAMAKDDDWYNKSVVGVYFYSANGKSDLICNYINKSLIFSYVPTNCYIYSHIYTEKFSYGGHILFYGNFTKYHLGYEKNDILCVGNRGRVYFADTVDEGFRMIEQPNYTHFGDTSTGDSELGCLFYCHPEASNAKADNFWFSSPIPDSSTYIPPTDPPPISTSFGTRVDNYFRVPDYSNIYFNTKGRDKTMISNTLNSISILMPLIVFGMREPKLLNNWSAIGESKLVNMIDMSHMNSGEIIINNGIFNDFHKYFVFPALFDYRGIFEYDPDDKETYTSGDKEYAFLGIAMEIWAKENLLHSQSQDYLTINLEDRYRNFDRIVIEYSGGKVEWLYDDLNDLFDTSGIFNLTKDDSNRCMVYGLRNENGESTEYRFTCSEGCEIISITGYRE